jgi:predicted phage terminase large subunit-like protein
MQSSERQEKLRRVTEALKGTWKSPKDLIWDEKCRRSLWEFAKRFWSVVEPSSPLLLPAPHLEAVCNHLQAVTEGKIHYLDINIPPGHGKSLVACVLWTAWEWLNRPWTKVLAGSYALELSIRDSIRCRELIGTDEYQSLIPRDPNTGLPKWKVTAPDKRDVFGNSAGGSRQTFATNSKITGFRGHHVIWDDPLNASDVTSEAALNEAIRIHDQVLPSRVIDPRTASEVLIMQRLHERDPSGHVLWKNRRFDHLCFPTEYEGGNSCACPEGTKCSQRGGTSIGFRDWRTEQGELLNPMMFDQSVIDRLKTGGMDLWAYTGQHQQRPSPLSGSELKREWLRNRYKMLPPGKGLWWTAWDLRNGGRSPRSSYAVGQVWYAPFSKPGEFYLIHQVRGRWEYAEEVEEFVRLTKQFPQATEHRIENKADARVLIPQIKAQIPGLIPWEPGTSNKAARFRVVLPLYKSGAVWYPEDDVVTAPGIHARDWIGQHIEEACGFPSAPNDDIIDVITIALSDRAIPQTRKSPLWWQD